MQLAGDNSSGPSTFAASAEDCVGKYVNFAQVLPSARCRNLGCALLRLLHSIDQGKVSGMPSKVLVSTVSPAVLAISLQPRSSRPSPVSKYSAKWNLQVQPLPEERSKNAGLPYPHYVPNPAQLRSACACQELFTALTPALELLHIKARFNNTCVCPQPWLSIRRRDAHPQVNSVS